MRESIGIPSYANDFAARNYNMCLHFVLVPTTLVHVAETRHLVPFALEIAQAMHSYLNTIHSMSVLRCIIALIDFSPFAWNLGGF